MSRAIGPTVRALRAVGMVSLPFLLVACSAIRFGGPDHDVSGSWQGAVTVQGDRIPGSLAIEQDGFVLDAGFAAPDVGLNATGTGEIDDDGAVRIVLEYDLQCPGTAVLQGTVSEDDTVLAGTVRATDCTGTVDGTFRFTR